MGLTTQTFDVLTRIAIGNGSLVYRAVEKTTLRQVALKLLTKDEELDHCFDIAALLEAAPQLRQIAGSHVCQLLDAYEDEDGPLLVYEYANGISGNEFPHLRKLDAAQAVDVAAQLMSALRSGERQQTPHGDLKPSNVIFVDTPEGRPFLFVLDWGLAAFRAELTKDSMPYLAPERLNGDTVSHQADLFSAGALLFYLLTGKVLAMGATADELRSGWSRARPELLAELRPDLPAKLVQWIASLLALDPRKRPASAVDAASALGALHPPRPMVAPEAIRPRPLSASQRAQAAGPASGIIAPIPSRVSVAPLSGVGSTSASGTRSVPGPRSASGSGTRDAVVSAKTGRATMLAISIGVAAAIAGTGIWWFKRKKTPVPIAAMETARSRTAPPPGAPASSKPADQADAVKVVKPPRKDAPDKSKPTSAPKPAAAKSAEPRIAPSPPSIPAPLKSKVGPNRGVEPLVIESFSYGDTARLQRQSAGRGWAGAWQGHGARLGGLSLDYPAHPSAGGSLLIRPANETVSVTRVAGPLSRMIDKQKTNAHWYFSALVSHSDALATPGGEVRIYPIEPVDGPNSIHIAITDVGDRLTVSMPAADAPMTVANANQPLLLVCRIDVSEPANGKSDVSVSLLVNPSFDATGFKEAGKPMIATVKNVELPGQTGLLIRKNPGTATTAVDEIRYTHHWWEISFKPAKPPAISSKSAAK